MPTLDSDAYATGEVLYALIATKALASDAVAYQEGMRFLLRTQRSDGSWFVATRAFPVQRAMEEVFPHGADQWISSSATTWAALALMMGAPSEPSSVAVSVHGDR